MVITTKEIAEKLKEIITNELGVTENQITPEAHLTRDFSTDRVGRSELLLVIEQEFNVDFSVDEEDRLTTIGSVIKLLKEKLGVN